MKPEHRQYIKDNMLLYTTSRRYSPEETRMMFEILSDVTNTPTRPTKCGRCVENAKKQYYFIMEEYKVYETKKTKKYTFKPYGEHVAIIKATTKSYAQAALDGLNKALREDGIQ